MLAVQHEPPGMNSDAWLRTAAAIAVKASVSIACTSALASSSAAIAARMRCRSSCVRSARR
eukprot:4483408-Prymnesium_polylepis.1